MKRKLLVCLTIMLLTVFAVRSFQALADEEEKPESDFVAQNKEVLLDSPLFTSMEEMVSYKQAEIDNTGFTHIATSPNGQFKLYIDETEGKNGTGAIRVLNTKTGYFWCSDVPNIDDLVSSASARRDARSSIQMVCVKTKDPVPSTPVGTADSDITLKIINKTSTSVTYKLHHTKADIELDYTVTVTNSGLEFSLLREDIKENNPEYILKSIQVFPYFGATYKKEVPGYAFIPSGNGALIRYSSESVLSASGVKRKYYGSDENLVINNEADILSLPVFGSVQGVNQDAMLARIKSGSAMAELTYIPAVNTSLFNRIYNSFVYRDAMTMTIPGGGTVPIYDKELSPEDISMSYTFLSNDDANYVGMAKQYQQDLVNDGILTKNANSGSTNVHVDVFGGETEKGILFDSYVKMTTTDQLLEINEQLTDVLDNKFKYTLRGYYRNGYSRQTASNISFDSRLGSLRDLEGLDYELYYNPIETYNSSLKYPGEVLVSITSDKHYVEIEADAKYKFYTRVNTVLSGVEDAIDKYDSQIAFDALGYRLYGDSKAGYFRTQTMDLYVASLNEGKYSMYRPNEYFLKNTEEYLTAPLYHGRQRYITDSVPFLQIVLRGYVDYYSSYLNFSTNQTIDTLKCIEYGSNPAYLVTYEPSHLLSNTLSNHLYATHFDSNKESIIEHTRMITEALSGVVGERIVAREVLALGVVKVSYSNGTVIYVNYTNSVQKFDGVSIEKENYKVVA